MVKTAVLVDGGFFLKRYMTLFSGCSDYCKFDSEQTIKVFRKLAYKHIHSEKSEELYRIFYYDCKPFDKRIHNPISKRSIDFAKSDVANYRLDFFDALKKQRKVALRLGYLKDHVGWVIKPQQTKELLKAKISVSDLNENDLYYDLAQKGVDMKIGLDISSLAYKKQVNRIVLISGDSDFVPAAKVARREGIDFILDPMWNHIHDDLFEHIDGLRSTCPSSKNFPDTIHEFISTLRK